MDDEILRAANPFDPEDDVCGCPRCKSVDSTVYACDEPGCWKDASCGTPTEAGYRSTCGAHRPDQTPAHVCGLQGYNPMIDPRCPGCVARNG
jgi:hypothetical protein